MRNAKLFVEGRWGSGASTRTLDAVYGSRPVAEIEQASVEQTRSAIDHLVGAARDQPLAPDERRRILARASVLLADRSPTLREDIVDETGFTLREADAEIKRACETLRLCAEEAGRLVGEMVPIDGSPSGEGRVAFTIRVPVGVVCAITPFNSPLNTVCHKVGPALAAGNAVVLKPAPQTPLSANALTEVLLEAGLPATHLALVHGDSEELGGALLEHRDVGFYTFTGSTRVGKIIHQGAGLRRTQLELGSLASVIVAEDADIEMAVAKTTAACFRKAGQVCTSVQRAYVHESVASRFVDTLLEGLRDAKAGDPRAEDSFIGPLISLDAAERVEYWVNEAVDGGARLLCGGGRDGKLFEPTVLTDVDPRMRVMCEEVFGPVMVLRTFTDVDDAIEEANDTPYGLSAGFFTRRTDLAWRAARHLRVGAVHINEASSSRVDLMPFGGVKESGFGREGPRYAIREMSEERLVTMRP